MILTSNLDLSLIFESINIEQPVAFAVFSIIYDIVLGRKSVSQSLSKQNIEKLKLKYSRCTDIDDHEVWQLKEKLDNILESVRTIVTIFTAMSFTLLLNRGIVTKFEVQSVAMVIVDRYPWMRRIVWADYKYRQRGNALTVSRADYSAQEQL